jgi:mitochondrial chaperone BCS1
MKGSQSRLESDSGSAQSSGATLSTKEVAPNQDGVTLSGLLNVLDGFAAPTGVLFVMTTNHVEKLDPALLCAGRIDYRLHLGKASDRQKVELYLRFFPESSEAEAWQFVEARRFAETMAEFQGLLLALAVKSFERREESSDRVAASHGILA